MSSWENLKLQARPTSRALRKIQELDLKTKGMNIDHFHEHVNYLTTTLTAHGMIMMDLMHNLFNAKKVCEDSELRDYLTEI